MGDSVVTPRAIAGCDMAAMRLRASMATKKAMQKKMASRKPQQGAGIAPQVSDEYQGYVFGLYPEWGTYPGSGDEVPGIPFDESKNAELEQGDIYPGGRFDPLNNLGMGNLEELKLKELKHCRLAMFAWLGLIAQAFATSPIGRSDNVGPIANWSAHVADPSGVNIVSVFANR